MVFAKIGEGVGGVALEGSFDKKHGLSILNQFMSIHFCQIPKEVFFSKYFFYWTQTYSSL